jgi:hypothetical protein
MRSKVLKVVRPVTDAWGTATTDFWTAASCHVFISLFVVFAAAYLFPGSVRDLFLAVVWLVTYVLVKEYVVDPRLEAGQDLRTGTVDASFYLVGLIVGLMLLNVAVAYLGRPW